MDKPHDPDPNDTLDSGLLSRVLLASLQVMSYGILRYKPNVTRDELANLAWRAAYHLDFALAQ